MSPSNSPTVDTSEWPVVPLATNGELSHQTDSDEPREPARRLIVCVLGMHRSGTSVATRLMNLLGFDLGSEEHLLGPRPDNPKGFWEYAPILELNDEILRRLGGNWREPPPLPPGWETSDDFADLRQKARDLVAHTFRSADWGWKDPRTCLTLPFWRRILPPIHYVICMRSPAEVAASLEQREGLPMEQSIRLWQIYTAAAIEHTAGLPRHFIFYEGVIDSPCEEVSRLARFLGRSEALAQPDIRAAIDDFLEPELHRHRTSLINTLDNPNILYPAKALYFAVRLAASNKESCHGLSGLQGRGWNPLGEQVWSVFSHSTRRAQEDRDELTRNRAGLESRLGEISAEAQDLRARLSDLEMKAADREAALSAIQARWQELEADNQRLAQEQDQARALANEIRSALNEREAACHEQAKVIDTRDAEIAALAPRAALAQQLEAECGAHQAEIHSIQASLSEREADNQRLSDERDRAQSRTSELGTAIEQRDAACEQQAQVIASLSAQVAALTERTALVDRWEEDRQARQAEMFALSAGLAAIASDNRRLAEQRDEIAILLEARNAELTGQIGGLAAELAAMRSREISREEVMPQIRDQLLARQDDIQAMVSRLGGTIDYLGMVRRVRADMRRLLPPAAKVIVISKGDPDFLDVEGQDARHFPQDERGNYAGHYPPESGEAIAHLEEHRARGGRFLVIPSSASWWLDHYDGLSNHLDTHYQRIWKSADCQIYKLDPPELNSPSTARDVPSAPSITSPPPPPDPDSILAVCDMPGEDLVTIGPGHLRVRGWALAKARVERVSVFVDGLAREGVSYGSARFDVEAAHPEFPNAHHSGFVGKIDLEGLRDGEHSLVVRIRSRDGYELELNRSFRLDPDARPDRRDLNVEYPEWLAKRTPSESDLARMRVDGMNLHYQPVISLVVPVYNTPEKYLSLMVDSVMAQTYARWELCLANGGSTAPHVRPFLTSLAAQQDHRIKIVHLPKNLGISGHSNAALALATGEFMGLLDSDDVLMPHALFEVVRALNEAPGTDLIYSDEDKTDDTGEERWEPFFKPDWSPDLLLSNNYICHFGVYRRSVVEAIGGFRSEYDWSQDYDLVLRFTERTNRIVHLPSILYSWRAIPGSTARDMMAKPDAVNAARRAVDDALRRRGVSGRAEPGFSLGQWRVRYDLVDQPAVTVVIAAGGNMKCLQPCLESVLERSTYPNLHVLVTDDSDGTAVADLCRDLGRRHQRLSYRRFRIKPFNYSAINNSAVSVVDTPYIVLLNDDVTVNTPDWIQAMLEHAQRPEVGVVGALLLYPDQSIQHAGVVMGPYQNCCHAFKHFSENDPGYFSLARIIHNCSAVTFACAMMKRSVFDEVGGLDEQNLAVAYNDVDMCLRVRERGYSVVYTPYAILFHHESATRNMPSNPGEEDYMHRRWSSVIRHDPFYNPNLTRESDDYSLNFDAPTVAQRLGPIEVGPLTDRHRPLFVNHRAAGNTEHLIPNPLPTAAPPTVDAAEGLNGYRPKRNRYAEVRRRIREVVNAELPTGSVVLVVSRGDDNVLQLGPRRGWHFPQTETGVYAGFYPADSAEAIAHLEEVRRKGADYLLFPSTAFWWLAFYGDFQKYLESHYPCICSDPTCLIFQLSTNPRGHA